MPMTIVTLPASISSGGLVSASHLTKKACSAVPPIKAPVRQIRVRKAVTSRRIAFHKASSLGWKTIRARALLDRFFDHVEQPAHVQIAPFAIGLQGAGAPYDNAFAGKDANAVDPGLIQAALALFGVCQALCNAQGAGGLARSAGALRTPGWHPTRPNAGNMPGRWNVQARLSMGLSGSRTQIQGK